MLWHAISSCLKGKITHSLAVLDKIGRGGNIADELCTGKVIVMQYSSTVQFGIKSS